MGAEFWSFSYILRSGIRRYKLTDSSVGGLADRVLQEREEIQGIGK
jgi:hypothetical protein